MKTIASLRAWWLAFRSGLVLAAATWSAVAISATAPVSESYKIQPTDILVIDVYGEPQLGAKEFRVSANGEISYPFIKEIKVADRTITEIQTELKRLLEADYLVNAQVIVQVKEFRKQTYTIIGQVVRPGVFEIPAERKLTVLEAIGTAGGPTRLARTSDIELIRRRSGSEPLRFSLDELKNSDRAVHIEDGDVINIKESRI
jgi:protein involved in polysaccharide export with SLBB domain